MPRCKGVMEVRGTILKSIITDGFSSADAGVCTVKAGRFECEIVMLCASWAGGS